MGFVTCRNWRQRDQCAREYYSRHALLSGAHSPLMPDQPGVGAIDRGRCGAELATLCPPERQNTAQVPVLLCVLPPLLGHSTMYRGLRKGRKTLGKFRSYKPETNLIIHIQSIIFKIILPPTYLNYIFVFTGVISSAKKYRRVTTSRHRPPSWHHTRGSEMCHFLVLF